MGCLFSREVEEELAEPAKKEYSWDKRKHMRKEDYMLENLQDKSIVRLPSSINGQQFLIQNCSNCNIYLLDHSAAINMDNCSDCQVITGPIKGSLFLRNCKKCKVLSACQQFRTRDCLKTDVFIFCMTQPIIEASSRMQFGCYQLSYNGIEEQFKQSGLEVMNNTWDSIYDFTPNPEQGPNWKLVAEDYKMEDTFTLKLDENCGDGDNHGAEESLNKSSIPEDLFFNFNSESSVVPFTAGTRGRISEESSLIIFFNQEEMSKNVLKIIKELNSQSVNLIRSKMTTLPEERVSEMFDKATQTKFFNAAKQSPVIGLEVNGSDCNRKCLDALSSNCCDTLFFLSDSWQLIELFYSGIDMQMI